jgi:hypothetical protein
MPKRKVDTRALRQLADDLLRSIMPDDVPGFPRQDFVTSLVRQWITYDGHATLFTGEDQVYFLLGKSPLGKRGSFRSRARMVGCGGPAPPGTSAPNRFRTSSTS